MKKIVFGILLLVVVGGSAFFVFQQRKAGEEGFSYSQSSADIQIKPKESNFAAGQRSIFQVSAGSIEGEAVLTPVPAAGEGGSLVEAQLYGVKSAFQERPAPYGGQITAKIACDSQKYIQERAIPFGGGDGWLILAVASGRRLYGSCTAEEIKYASVFWAAFDEKKMQAVTVKLFKPVGSLEEIGASQQELVRVLRRVMGLPE